MKLKRNLKMVGKLEIARLCLVVGCLLYFVSREFYDEQKQVLDTLSTTEDFNNTGEEIIREFLPGEHRIIRTRIDSFGYQTEPIDGYTIESVNLKSLSNKNIIIYVNTLPVVVRGECHGDGTITFDELGEVITKDSVKVMRK